MTGRSIALSPQRAPAASLRRLGRRGVGRPTSSGRSCSSTNGSTSAKSRAIFMMSHSRDRDSQFDLPGRGRPDIRAPFHQLVLGTPLAIATAIRPTADRSRRTACWPSRSSACRWASASPPTSAPARISAGSTRASSCALRERIQVQRDVAIGNYLFTPYASAEVYFDTQYNQMSRYRLTLGGDAADLRAFQRGALSGPASGQCRQASPPSPMPLA